MLCQPAVIETAGCLKEFVRLASNGSAAPHHILARFLFLTVKYEATATARKMG